MLTDEAREKIGDIIYELNVEPDEIDGIVAQIAEAVGPKQITIDMAGAMDKITPEMMDQTRDMLIEALTRRVNDLGWHDIDTPPREGTIGSVLFSYKWEKKTCREIAHGAMYRNGVWWWPTMRENDKPLMYHVIPPIPDGV